jgi:hypothetical protein
MAVLRWMRYTVKKFVPLFTTTVGCGSFVSHLLLTIVSRCHLGPEDAGPVNQGERLASSRVTCVDSDGQRRPTPLGFSSIPNRQTSFVHLQPAPSNPSRLSSPPIRRSSLFSPAGGALERWRRLDAGAGGCMRKHGYKDSTPEVASAHPWCGDHQGRRPPSRPRSAASSPLRQHGWPASTSIALCSLHRHGRSASTSFLSLLRYVPMV